MNKFNQVLISVAIGVPLASVIVSQAFEIANNYRTLTPLESYNKAILQCQDNECRRAVNVFYTQILRDAATEVEDGKN